MYQFIHCFIGTLSIVSCNHKANTCLVECLSGSLYLFDRLFGDSDSIGAFELGNCHGDLRIKRSECHLVTEPIFTLFFAVFIVAYNFRLFLHPFLIADQRILIVLDIIAILYIGDILQVDRRAHIGSDDQVFEIIDRIDRILHTKDNQLFPAVFGIDKRCIGGDRFDRLRHLPQ